jgi:hypothetical protein
MVGEPVLAFGALTMGATAGALLPLTALAASTPVVPSGTHRMSVSVCAQCSPEPHLPLQGKASHKPVLVLQNISPVQMAMQPPAARDAAAAPTARLVVAAAPIRVFGLPVLQAASSARTETAAILLMRPRYYTDHGLAFRLDRNGRNARAKKRRYVSRTAMVCPTCSDRARCPLRPFSLRSLSTVVENFAAIVQSVSPGLTV